MRILLVSLLLVSAGCLGLGGDTPAASSDDGSVAAAGDPAGPTTASPTPASPAAPASTPPPAEPSPEAPNATEPAPEPEPPAPEPVAWELVDGFALGYLVGAGAGGAEGAPSGGVNNEAHCHEASFAVPEGAAVLDLGIIADHVDPNEPGAGTYDVQLTAPDGTTVHLEPVMETAGAAGNARFHAEPPAVGAWNVRVVPIGPAANQAWDITLGVSGASLVAPADLGVATASCG